MKKIMLLLILATTVTVAAYTQAPQKVKKIMELKMTPKLEEDAMAGTRGASIVWHPVQKKYYASFAGNQDYPMAIFNAAGKRLSSDNQTTLIDTRGLWYNPVKKQICGNGYNDNGWFSYTLNNLGLVNKLNNDFTGMNQPDQQSSGAFHTAKKQVMFLQGSQIWFYNDSAAASENKTTIHWGLTAKDGIAASEDETTTPEGYNSTTIIYSGINGAEAGMLNTIDKQVELYNTKTGFLVKKIKLPEDAPTETIFNFAFTNGIYWLFDMEKRVWIGYK